jgi:hypothetical protein
MSARAAEGPGSVPDPLLPEAEAAFYRTLGDAERARMLESVCRAGARLLEAQDDPHRAARHSDPVPPSTMAALQRLRAEFRARHERPEASLRSPSS